MQRTPETFDKGIQTLLTLFPADFQSEDGKRRRNAYYSVLKILPDEAFLEGVVRCMREWKRTAKISFPEASELGEFSIPGDAITEVREGMSRWKKIKTPWTERLKQIEIK